MNFDVSLFMRNINEINSRNSNSSLERNGIGSFGMIMRKQLINLWKLFDGKIGSIGRIKNPLKYKQFC